MKKEKAPLGLYIHIPFCRQKCAYCDFYSLPSREDKMDAYTDALIRHIREVAPRTESHRVDTVYFGGGTPSYLGAERLRSILRAVMKGCPVTRDAEITLEANPDSACDIKALRTLHRAGFNRLSLGVQSADDGLLRAIGRIHTFAQVQQSVTAARKAGFRNVSMDLIYGLPGQTMQQWEDTLSAVIALAPEHISCYGLKLEPGTPLYERRLEETFPDDDAQADMYLYAVTALEQNGYGQYEISNFAKPPQPEVLADAGVRRLRPRRPLRFRRRAVRLCPGSGRVHRRQADPLRVGERRHIDPRLRIRHAVPAHGGGHRQPVFRDDVPPAVPAHGGAARAV